MENVKPKKSHEAQIKKDLEFKDVNQKWELLDERLMCEHFQCHSCTHTHTDLLLLYSHLGLNRVISGMQNNKELERGGLAEGVRAFLLQFFWSLLFWSVCCFDCKCEMWQPFGWLLSYYWVSGKPAREAPVGCTKYCLAVGVNGSVLGRSTGRTTGRRIRWVCSWSPLPSNRSLAGALCSQIPARQRGSCCSM